MTSPVPGWDSVVLAASEATFGTVPNPAAAQAMRVVDLVTGPTELGDIRPQRDRNVGREMQAAFVEGRVKGIPWSIEKSIMTRATAVTVPDESVLWKAAGLLETVGGSSVAYTLRGSPDLDGSLVSASLYRLFGKGTSTVFADQLRGCVIKTLSLAGGDRELTFKAAGDAIGKHHLGRITSVTLVDGSGTTLTLGSADEADQLGLGWYQIEAEVIKVTALASTTTRTIARAQLSTTGAAHAAQVMRPYVPTLSFSGAPIPESGTVTVTLDAVVQRCMAFEVSLSTGIDLLPGESGSKYIQGAKVIRCDVTATLKMVMSKTNAVSLLGKITRKKTPIALTLVQSTGVAGGIVTISMPYCELNPFPIPATANDAVIIDVSLRSFGSAGNDAISVTMT